MNIAVSPEGWPLSVTNIQRADTRSPVPFGHVLADFNCAVGSLASDR
jgi:hypothetical protein